MTDDRAKALLAMDLSEVPAYTATTLWSHLQDALRDRAIYQRLAEENRKLAEHIERGLCKYIGMVRELAAKLQDDQRLLARNPFAKY